MCNWEPANFAGRVSQLRTGEGSPAATRMPLRRATNRPPALALPALSLCSEEEEEQDNGVEVPSSEEESELEDAPLDDEEEEEVR